MSSRKNTASEINFLNRRIAEIEERLSSLREQDKNLRKQIREEERRLLTAKEKLERLTKKAEEPILTDHALVRYLERVKGIDIAQMKKEILNDKLRELIGTLGNGKFPCDGFTAIVKDNQVITILDGDKK
jgi:predicted RNase H-like nuclease (RuvC/YqgF family)